MNYRKVIADRLKFYREREGWTTKDVACRIGMQQRNYERIEEAKVAVNIDTLSGIANLYGCHVDIVQDDNDMPIKMAAPK